MMHMMHDVQLLPSTLIKSQCVANATLRCTLLLQLYVLCWWPLVLLRWRSSNKCLVKQMHKAQASVPGLCQLITSG